jgi:hypothetical protein
MLAAMTAAVIRIAKNLPVVFRRCLRGCCGGTAEMVFRQYGPSV